MMKNLIIGLCMMLMLVTSVSALTFRYDLTPVAPVYTLHHIGDVEVGLNPNNDSVLYREAGVWVAKDVADLAITESDPVWNSEKHLYATITWVNGLPVSTFTNDAGYITGFTEVDPIFTAHPSYGITNTFITNWNAAYGWGDHSTQGYLTSESDPTYFTNPSNFLNATTLDVTMLDLSNYYNVTEVDELLATLTVDLSVYYNITEIDELLNVITAEFNDYYNITEIDALLSGVISLFNSYYTKSEINSIIEDYYTKSEIDFITGGDPFNASLYHDSTFIEENFASKLYVQSRGEVLVSNGWGTMGNTYNWDSNPDSYSSSLGEQNRIYYFTDDSVGGSSSFAYRVPSSTAGNPFPITLNSVESVAVDPSKDYYLSGYFKTYEDNTLGNIGTRVWFGITPLDKDGNQIRLQHFLPVQLCSRTYLSQPIHNGDTKVFVDDVSCFVGGSSSSSFRYLAVFDDPYYYQFGDHYYTRNVLIYTDINESENSITIPAWNNGFIPSGTPAMNTRGGATYQYAGLNGVLIGDEWTHSTGIISSSYDYMNPSESHNLFRPATKELRIFMYLSGVSSSVENQTILFDGIELSETVPQNYNSFSVNNNEVTISNLVTSSLTVGESSVSSSLIQNWNTAFGWGNHASMGYVTGTPWTSMGYLTSVSQSDVTQHQAALSITESQISDLGSYIETESDPVWVSERNNYYNTTQIDAIQSNTMGFVNHGSNASVARPTGFGSITWVGTVEPANAEDYDIWIES